MIDKSKKKLNMKVQWTKFAVAAVLYLLFLYWVESWWGLLVLPFIFDVYITKKIRWQWWKDSVGPTRFIMSWVDAIVFALVAVYFINQFFFQNYVIPSSSLEKSLLTGDYLFVSKLSYGPRIPQTPLTMPLTQHTLPLFECKSYIEFPQWDYRRVKGTGKVELNDIVVFNFPAGDTICSAPQWQAQDYYQLCYGYGYQAYGREVAVDSLTPQQQWDYFREIYASGRRYLGQNRNTYGDIDSRPVDRRENYVKRCVGLPGQTLQIRNRIVYLDGRANKEPDNVQYTYRMKKVADFPDELMKELGISMEDLTCLNQNGYMPLTGKAAGELRKHRELVRDVRVSDHGNWRRLHWNALATAYGDSPFFDYYADDLHPMYVRKYDFLLDFNMEMTRLLCQLLDVRPQVELTTAYTAEAENDFRDVIRPKHPVTDDGFVPRRYYQVHGAARGFIPNLSVLDLLFNMGNEAIVYL